MVNQKNNFSIVIILIFKHIYFLFNQNLIYLITGRTLLFNSTLILVLVLRYTITKLRELGLAVVLPVDNNIYLHKVTGWLIFIQSLFHTVMHLCNFGKRKVILESKSIFNRLLRFND